MSNAKIKPPYLLVSHGASALAARLFYRDHAKDSAGLVFVEPGVPTNRQDMLPLLPPESANDGQAVKSWRASLFNTDWSAFPENMDWDTSAAQAAKVTSLGNTPLIVLWMSQATIDGYNQGLPANLADGMKQLDGKWERDTTQLSTTSEVRYGTLSGYGLPMQEAPLVVKAILDMLQQVKSK